MKHPWPVSIDSPASVQNWLESKGIDGNYTSCILGFIQVYTYKLCGPECQNNTLKYQQNLEQIGTENQYILSTSKASHKRLKCCDRGLSKNNTALCTSNSSVKTEDRKKCIAVEYVKPACEQKSSIEPLGVNESAEILNSLEGRREEIICESEQKSSSLEEQTEFFAAFSSLSGKPEPLTKLCPQQDRKNSKCVWNDNRITKHVYQTGIHKLQQSILNMEEGHKMMKQGDRARDEDKESQWQNIFNVGKEVAGSKAVKEEPNVTGDLETWKPSFVVPKMKSSCSRVPFTIKHSPFNVLSNIQANLSIHLESHLASDTMTNSLEKSKEDDCPKVASSEADDLLILEDKENIQMLDSEQVEKIFLKTTPKKLLHDPDYKADSPFTWEHWKFALGPGDILSEESLDKKLVDNLVNKFNESVAAIWGKTDDLPPNENLDLKTSPQEVEFSLKMLTSMFANSAKFQTQNYRENKNLNPIQGYSVWSAGYDDLKTLSLNGNSSPFALSSLRRNFAAGIISGLLASGIGLGKTTRYPEGYQSPALSEHIQYFPKGSFVFGKDEDNVHDDDRDLDDTLSLHPDVISLSLEDDEILMSSSENDSREESPVISFVGSKVHLWKDIPEHVTQPLEHSGGDCWLPFLSTNKTFSVFCSSNKGEDKTENNFSFGNLTEQNLDWKKDDCRGQQDFHYCTTLTHHKGESKFVEVVPSYRKKNQDDDQVGEYYNDAYTSFSKYEVNVEEEENLLTSPRTHFQPIREESFDSENSDDTEIVTLTVKQDGESPEFVVDPNDIDETQANQLLGSSDFNDKLDNNEKLKENDHTRHIGRRKRTVSSSCEELVSLTGAFNLDETGSGSSSLTEEEKNQVSSSFSRTTDLYEDKGTNTEASDYYGLWEDKLQDDVDGFSLASGSNSLFSVFEEDQWNCTDVSCKWSTNDHEKTTWVYEVTEAPHDSKMLRVSDKDMVFEKTDLNLLREELEAEEEELLRDITRVKDRWGDVIELKEQNLFQDYLSFEDLENTKSGICCEEDSASVYPRFDGFYSNLGENYQDLAQYWDMGNLDYKSKEQCTVELQDLDNTSYPPVTFLPAENVFFSSHLEEEWIRDSSPFGEQIPRRKKPKSRVLSQKRPCTFYLEGKCLRKDCRFSHDLSRITCRFWEDSSCFKGVTCPFLHGYPSPVEDTFGTENSTKRSFLLESENDFPSLSKSVENPISEGNKGLRMGRKRGKREEKYPVED